MAKLLHGVADQILIHSALNGFEKYFINLALALSNLMYEEIFQAPDLRLNERQSPASFPKAGASLRGLVT